MEIRGNLNRRYLVLIFLGLLFLPAVPVTADDGIHIPYIGFWMDPNSCEIGHLTDCKITFGVYYGYLGIEGRDWDIIMTWNPLQMKMIQPMHNCLYKDSGDGYDLCGGADYDGSRTMTLQVNNPTLPRGTLLTTHISAQGSERFEKDVSAVVVPEFPTTLIPVTLIIGFLVTVMHVRKTGKP
ncbi:MULTISPECIES: hypothetical protein [unclassified Methanoregula]|uniref:hypothetical protein n=1 Tax=unclassified Methanoregula TaxID=2649730 RepID=UPI0009C784EB|nr:MULTISPECIES: hypothetical protein [unclassified Methanoregula]OPX64112.1 MAG: hypothetical protein A4E33_01135 [Methanoregula sp. PtaB.Bin085]OPY34768.1 MAG: hypothetical protein A4E34_01298 [Methanoregula sp. PtaU1.Bin006]